MLLSVVDREWVQAPSVADPNLVTWRYLFLPVDMPAPLAFPDSLHSGERQQRAREQVLQRQRSLRFITSARKFQNPQASCDLDAPFRDLLLIGAAENLPANRHGRCETRNFTAWQREIWRDSGINLRKREGKKTKKVISSQIIRQVLLLPLQPRQAMIIFSINYKQRGKQPAILSQTLGLMFCFS